MRTPEQCSGCGGFYGKGHKCPTTEPAQVVYIGAVAVETNSISTAAKVAVKASKKDAVRGTVIVAGRKCRWATIQQYEYHGGFAKRAPNKNSTTSSVV